LNESTRVLVALGAALAISASGSASFIRPADFIAPVGTLWLHAIRMTVIPLVASLLIVVVGSTGDTKFIGRIGRRTLLVFFVLLAGTAMAVMPLAATVSRLAPQHASAHQLPFGATDAA
jgi:proton glutamate symport protein